MIVTREELYRVRVPQETSTYKPISNKVLIDSVREIAHGFGHTITNELYRTNNAMTQMTGLLTIPTDDKEQGMSIGLLNSYDKSKKVGIGAGSVVFLCLNGVFNAEFKEVRKHQGSIQDDLEDIIKGQLMEMENRHNKLIKFREDIKKLFVSRQDVAHLLGEMYLNDIVRVTQLSKIKEGMIKDTKGIFGEQVSLWRVYNWVTESLKSEHPSSLFDAHVDFHKFIEQKFNNYIDTEYYEE
jgi:hypothetical protein